MLTCRDTITVSLSNHSGNLHDYNYVVLLAGKQEPVNVVALVLETDTLGKNIGMAQGIPQCEIIHINHVLYPIHIWSPTPFIMSLLCFFS